MNQSVELLTSGLYSTLQDSGRFGFRRLGVPQSGAMDPYSFAFANSLLNNDTNCTAIEWYRTAPILLFHQNTIISLTGASGNAFLNEKPVLHYKSLRVRENDILRIQNVNYGNYGYIAIKNGFLTSKIMESTSQYKNITPKFRLHKGDFLSYTSVDYDQKRYTHIKPLFDATDAALIVFPGPEFDQMSKAQQKQLLTESWTLSPQQDRMAFVLQEKLEHTLPQITSSPVLPGTVQLTPDGSLIVLMHDCQTTGGYPRVLQLTQRSVGRLSQMRTGQSIRFRKIAIKL